MAKGKNREAVTIKSPEDATSAPVAKATEEDVLIAALHRMYDGVVTEADRKIVAREFDRIATKDWRPLLKLVGSRGLDRLADGIMRESAAGAMRSIANGLGYDESSALDRLLID